MNNYKTDEFEIDRLVILDAKELLFSRNESGYLNLDYKGKKYEQVTLSRLIPYYERSRYISVSFQNEDKEWIEIGIIRDISEMNGEQLEIVENYLSFRYYIPEITKIYDITDNRMGYLFINAETTAGKKRIAVNDWWTNFKVRENNTLSVTDADGNRYAVPDVHNMDRKSLKKLQLFI